MKFFIFIIFNLLNSGNSLKIHNLIGNTPLVKLSNKINPYHNDINIYLKLEYYNPSGSIKDRIVNYIIQDGFKKNKITPDTIILEASSGNTASSIALLSSYYNLKSIVCTNTKCSNEKVNFIRSFKNTELLIKKSSDSSDPEYYQNVVLRMANENKNYYHLNQYNNVLNSDAFYYSLGPEIWNQTNQQIDYFICASGTGGTITGTSKYLKEQNKNIKTILIDPPGSIFSDYIKLNKTIIPPKKDIKFTMIEGIGKDNIPGTLNFDYIDDVINIRDENAIKTCRELANLEGIVAGGSGGANVFGALKLAENIIKTKKKNGKINIVTVIPDTGLKYISKIYNDEWLKNNNLII
jgi:cystathionine beta-synthase/cysteine synthase A